jgi:neutral ceramidase
MGGYDLRNAPSDGVWDKIYLRTLIMEVNGSRLAFIVADLGVAANTDMYRKSIAQETGIAYENIFIGATHDHSAPAGGAQSAYAGANQNRPVQYGGNRNAEWTKMYEAAYVPMVKEAIGNLRPVNVACGQGSSRIAMNRRAMAPTDHASFDSFDENNVSQFFGKFQTDHPVKIHEFEGEVRLGANPLGSIDDAVQLVRLDDAQGKPYALMIHYACHGTTLGGRNSKVSGEWMGHMDSFVESQIPGVNVIYLQGAAGDINPRVVGGLDGNKDDIQTTYALGEEIGREVVRTYRTLAPVPLAPVRLEVATRDILMPMNYRLLAANFTDPAVHTPTTALRIGDMMWVTFPGEMFHNIGKKVKAACPATAAHLMGYTNGYIGYFPEQKAFGEGGYEPSGARMAPNAEHIYLRQIAELMNSFAV